MQLITNGNNDDDSQSHCNATAYTTHVHTTRGKSLSPPKVAAFRKQTIHSTAYLSRSLNQRHTFLRKQKLIAKAKQQHLQLYQARLSPSATSPTAMGKSIARVEITPPKESTKTTTAVAVTTDTAEKLNAEKDTEKDNASDSEYSSLEDDDDVQGEQCKECAFLCQSTIQ